MRLLRSEMLVAHPAVILSTWMLIIILIIGVVVVVVGHPGGLDCVLLVS